MRQMLSWLWATLRRRPVPDPDARLSPEELQAVIDRINTRVRAEIELREEMRRNLGRRHYQ